MANFFSDAFTWIIFGLMVLSLFSLVVPVFPGGVVIWLLALIYGIVNPGHFGVLGGWMFAIITLLMFASAAADNLLMGVKAREKGASWQGLILALVAGVIAALFLTPIGGLVVAGLTLYLVEYRRLGDSEKAIDITKGLLIGCGWAFFVRFGLGVIKIVLWGIWAFNNN